jgi:hypothetical protein
MPSIFEYSLTTLESTLQLLGRLHKDTEGHLEDYDLHWTNDAILAQHDLDNGHSSQDMLPLAIEYCTHYR